MIAPAPRMSGRLAVALVLLFATLLGLAITALIRPAKVGPPAPPPAAPATR